MPILDDFSLEPCPNRLSADQVQRFQKDGYLAFANVLKPAELEEARNALREITHRMSNASSDEVEFTPPRLGNAGNHSGAKFHYKEGGCMMQLEAGFDPVKRTADEIEMQVRKYMTFVKKHETFERLVSAEHVIGRIVAALIGTNPILFQEMALVKPPFIGSEKPWHQDNAYFSVTPLNSVIGVWIALDDAQIENGCMHVIPGGHTIGALKHFHGTDCEIVEGRLDTSKALPVPVPAGGAMFFYGLLPHETPPNRSPQRRRALQFHFRSAESRIIESEEYDKLFAEADGTPASCDAARRQGI